MEENFLWENMILVIKILMAASELNLQELIYITQVLKMILF